MDCAINGGTKHEFNESKKSKELKSFVFIFFNLPTSPARDKLQKQYRAMSDQ